MRNIVSFTTIPSRINKIELTIESILNQSLKDYEVILWVSDSYNRLDGKLEIPKFISDTRIKVRYVKDVGPLTKMYYAIKENWGNENVNVITCDDDVIYPTTWLESLVSYSNKAPNVAVGYRGRYLPSNLNYCHSKLFESNKIDSPMDVDILTGTWGVLYKPTFFNEFFLNLKKEFFFNDDIWVFASLSQTNVGKYIIPKKGIKVNDSVFEIDDLTSHNMSLKCEANNIMLNYLKQ